MITANLVKALAQLIHMVLYVYSLIIIVRSLISWVGDIPPNAFTYALRRLTDPLFRFVHRYLPFTIVSGIDISPIIILITLYFIDNLVYSLLMNWSLSLAPSVL